jgi:hypothetical protein
MHSDGDVESWVKFHFPSARPTVCVCLAPLLLVAHWLTHLFEPDFAIAFDPVRAPRAWHVVCL